jgi:hypothetical protein
LSALSEDSAASPAPQAPAHGAGGPPNRPLPPTPDDDDAQGDRTLIMKRVSAWHPLKKNVEKKESNKKIGLCSFFYFCDQAFLFFVLLYF